MENNQNQQYQTYQDYQEYIDQYPVAMAYVPWQQTANVFEDLNTAFYIGTIFPELEKPFTGRRCVK